MTEHPVRHTSRTVARTSRTDFHLLDGFVVVSDMSLTSYPGGEAGHQRRCALCSVARTGTQVRLQRSASRAQQGSRSRCAQCTHGVKFQLFEPATHASSALPTETSAKSYPSCSSRRDFFCPSAQSTAGYRSMSTVTILPDAWARTDGTLRGPPELGPCATWWVVRGERHA
jgi:hypothetical protein